MAKKILVIYYSQSGQLRDIVCNIADPISSGSNVDITYYHIGLKEDFEFPWQGDQFMNTFPESYLQVSRELIPPPDEVLNTKFDLIIFGYQVWFLTPSIPVNSFLKSKYAGPIMGNTPVITVSATRNMWMLSQEKLKATLSELNAPLVGNIALVDRNNNYTSVITILRWMKTGRKQASGIWPEAGVASEEINEAGKYGRIIRKHLFLNNFESLQRDLVAAGAVVIRPFLVRVEKTGNRIFKMWSAKIIQKKSSRPLLVRMFTYYLFIAIWIISPIVLVLHLLLTPLLWQKRQKEKNYLLGTYYNPRQFRI